MARKKYTTEYINIRNVLNKFDTSYYLIYGERGDGKTYGGKEIVIDDYKDRGKRFVYMRRTHQHIVRSKMVKVFDDIQHYAEKMLNSKIYFDSQMGFYIIKDGEKEVVGYCTSVQDAMNVKSIPLVNIGYILFDEFIDYNYFENETSMFLHAISTICRPPNHDVKILMLGNTIHKDCPYFKLMGVDTSKIKQGQYYYLKHELGASITVYRTPTKVDSLVGNVKKDSYIGFDDNESVSMIMFGEWEYNNCITTQIDGVGWNCMKNLVPIYFTALGNVYEIAIHIDTQIPITFIRKVNTQNGKCSKLVKYNLTVDRSVNLINKRGIVPTITSVNDFIDENTLNKWSIFIKCLECGRIIYDKIETGSEFIHFYGKIKKGG